MIIKRDTKKNNGIVAAATPESAKIGVEILKKGGNAVDAAVAVGFALGVLEPNASGLGGGGYMLLKLASTNEEIFIDFREVASVNARGDMYTLDDEGKPIDKSNEIGPKSITVPGETAGLLGALEQYGTMTREEVMAPAISCAENGLKVTKVMEGHINKQLDVISEFKETSKIYLNSGNPLVEGEQIYNYRLVETLKTISKNGAEEFYKGELASRIVENLNKIGSIITINDFNEYCIKKRETIRGTYRGYEIISAPPSSCGGAHVIQLLNIMENHNMKEVGFNTAESWHMWAEAMKMVYEDRAKYMADTDFMKVPLEGIISKEYAKELYNKIRIDRSMEKSEIDDPWKYESGSTTHYSIIDKYGNMVAVTKTIGHFFGSGITVPKTGIIMNDQMMNFDTKPGKPNSIEPKKRPLSNMSPTFILKDGKPFATLGTPGGRRIISTIALIISNIIDHEMDIQEAINSPRIHQYIDGNLMIESRIPHNVRKDLIDRGHEIEVKKDFDLYFGGAQGIIKNQETGELHGGADPRRDGLAVGY